MQYISNQIIYFREKIRLFFQIIFHRIIQTQTFQLLYQTLTTASLFLIISQ